MCTLSIAVKFAHDLHICKFTCLPLSHAPLPSSAMNETSATMLELPSAFPIAAATAIGEKKNAQQPG